MLLMTEAELIEYAVLDQLTTPGAVEDPTPVVEDLTPDESLAVIATVVEDEEEFESDLEDVYPYSEIAEDLNRALELLKTFKGLIFLIDEPLKGLLPAEKWEWTKFEAGVNAFLAQWEDR